MLALCTTLSFQILSNFANDYGDGIKGTDANRIGEKRLVASGEITSAQMKKAIIINSVIAFVLAVALIYFAFGQQNFVWVTRQGVAAANSAFGVHQTGTF